MLSTLKNCNIRVDSTTVPSLDSVSLPRAMRKEAIDVESEIQRLTLPRIVGVDHGDYCFELIADEIRNLPADSTVGLELGAATPDSSIFEHFPDLDIFKSLAKIAEEAGNEVLWLERGLTRFDSPQREWLKEAEATL